MKKTSEQPAEVETGGDVKKGPLSKIWEQVRSHPWFAMIPLLALLLTFFGINFKSIRAMFDWELFPTQEETFFF